MKVISTPIPDLFVLEPVVHGDDRGYFMESFKGDLFREKFPHIQFIQDNESKSTKGVLRGLHFQRPPYAQTKLVRAISGEVYDVAVDLRKGSETYGQHYGVLLSGENKKQLLVPKGFAHGFVVLSESAIFSYKVDNVYHPESDDGIFFGDQDLGIDWHLENKSLLLSEKDKLLTSFRNCNSPF